MDIDLELGRANGSAAATRRPEQPRIPEIDSAKRPKEGTCRVLFFLKSLQDGERLKIQKKREAKL